MSEQWIAKESTKIQKEGQEDRGTPEKLGGAPLAPLLVPGPQEDSLSFHNGSDECILCFTPAGWPSFRIFLGSLAGNPSLTV